MAEGIALSIAGKLAEYTVDPVLRQIKYLFFYNSNIQNLRDKVQGLENKRNDVQPRVDAAERNAEMIGEEVSAWLQKVDDLKEKADEVLNCVAGSEMRCLFNRCPSLKSRYLLSRRATKITIEADKLKVEGTFDRVSYPPQLVPVSNPTPHEEFETRLSIKKKIKEALKNKEIGIIGICGMPGVGKTTMANEIVKEVQSEKLFNEVAFAVVSNDPDVNKIQDQLAEMLGLKIEERTNSVRAGRLHQRLESKDGKSILVILDDVWKGIALETIGIPSPSDNKGLKIMFTTRIEDTCSEMEAQMKFKIQVLGEKEGWQLFKDMAGISDDETDELVSIAKKIANECGGLPLALEVVGRALKNKKAPHKWRDALQQLQKSSVDNLKGMHELVYSRIELSYNCLESKQDQDLILLCSLFAEDESIPIEDLVRYARGLQLFPNTETLPETRDRVYSIADNLKSCYLLQPGLEEGNEVKLHDVIRDFCLQMATKHKGGYLVKHAGLKEWPELDESCSAVSITFDKMDQFHGGLKYQNVKLLRVICRDLGAHNKSEEFFEDMKELRVIELKGMYIQIPTSIQLLTGLQTLCLISCNIDSESSMIESLKNLEILCFYDSYFVGYLPIALGNLSNLKSLDLRFRELFLSLQPGVLSGIKKLEELYLGNYISIEDEDQRYIIKELSSLTSLRAFQISTHDTEILKQMLRALSPENLENFQIIRTARPRSCSTEDYRVTRRLDYRVTRSLCLDCCGEENLPSCLQPEINSLMKRTYRLEIQKAKALKNLVSELDGDGFINLETLKVSYCVDFEYLIDATNSIPSGTFGKLEFLELISLPKLTEICNGNLPRAVFKPPFFCNLIIVRMFLCDKVRSLFWESVTKCLVNLEILVISSCPMIEEVVSTDGEEVTKTCKMLEFPKLERVYLCDLSRFKSFTSQSNSGVVCQTLFNQVAFPNMEYLDVHGLDCIVKLFGKEISITSLHKLTTITVGRCVKLLTIAEYDSIQLLQNLHYLTVDGCGALEVLFDFKGIKVTNDAEINMLGRLETLTLESLPELVHITRMVPKGICVFQNLTKLDVEDCKSLRYLFSPSVVNSLVVLESLTISECEALEEIIGREEEEDTSEIVIKPPLNLHHLRQAVSMDAKQNEVINMLEFPKLIELRLFYLTSFKRFKYVTNNDSILQTLFNQVTFPNMEDLHVLGLDCIVKLFGKEMPITSLPKPINIMVLQCVKLLTIAESDSIQLLQNLYYLTVERCGALEVLFDFEGIKVTNHAEINMLGGLGILTLESLPELVHITRMVPKGICVFQNLIILRVEDCKSLRYLFSSSIVNSLVALESLSIKRCEALEEIIGREEEEDTSEIVIKPPLNLHHFRQVVSMDAKQNEVINMLEFPKLIELEFFYLTSLKSFKSVTNNDSILQTLFNQVTLPNMENLVIKGLQYIVKLVSIMRVENSSKSLQNLERLKVEDCKALEVLFDFECLTVTNDDVETVLGQLKSLELKSLDKLVHITRMVPKGIHVFEKLTSLAVERCGSLKYLFSPSMASSLVALEFLKVSDCESIEEIVGKEEEEEVISETKIVEGKKIKIAFPNLNQLLLENLPSIQMFCSQNYELVIPSMKNLTVEKCPMMSNLHHFKQVVPNLVQLNLCYLSSFKTFISESNNDDFLRTLFNQVTLPNMENLVIKGLQYIVKLVSIRRVENSSKSLQDLERLEVEDCEELEVLFDFECLTVTNNHAETVLGRLESLRLKSLAKLMHIAGMVPKGICVFEKLNSLYVERCGSLKYLLSSSMANSLVALEILEVSDCESIEEIVGKEEEEGVSETKIVEGMKIRIVFPNLNCLSLKNLPRIQMLCSQNHELALPPVKNLTIENCPMLKKSNEEGSLAEEEQVHNE